MLCCTPRKSKLFDEMIHVDGCLAGFAGLHWSKNLEPKPRKPIVPVEEREEQQFTHEARRRRRPRLNCTGYQHSCPDRGCVTCLF